MKIKNPHETELELEVEVINSSTEMSIDGFLSSNKVSHDLAKIHHSLFKV